MGERVSILIRAAVLLVNCVAPSLLAAQVRINSNPATVPSYAEFQQRTDALVAIWTSGELQEPQLRIAVRGMLTTQNASEREIAMHALLRMGERSSFAASEIAALLADGTTPPSSSRSYFTFGRLAARALEAMGPGGQPALSAAVRGSDVESRRSALSVAQSITDPAIFDALVQAIHATERIDQGDAYLAIVQGAARFPTPALVAAYEDSNKRVRSACVAALGRIADPMGAEVLIRAFSDRDADVRRQSCEVLARSGSWLHDLRTVQPLIEIATTFQTDHIRADAVASLGNYAGDRVVKTLIRALDHPYIGTRGNAAMSLAKIRARAAAARLVEAMVATRHGGGWVDVQARRALESMGIEKALLARITHLSRPNLPASQLPGEGEPDIAALLRDLHSPDENTRLSARYPLTSADRIYPVDPLVTAFFQDPDPYVRGVCIDAIANIGDPRGAPVILQGLQIADAETRERARRAVARSGQWLHDRRAVDPLIEVIKTHEVDNVRSAAAFSLGYHRDDRIFAALLQALDDPFSEVRAGAIASLAKLGDRAAVPKLIELSRDPARSAGYLDLLAIDALGEIGGEEALHALEEHLRKGDPYSPVAAIALEKALGQRVIEFAPYQEWLRLNPPGAPSRPIPARQ